MSLEEIIKIDSALSIPKYKQIINSVYSAIEGGILKKGDKMDSINTICKLYSLSRDTVMIAFNELKAKGILISIPGKGYYIDSIKVNTQEKIFLLFDELNAFKEDLYNSFVSSLKNKAVVDIYFHHFNRKFFNSILKESIGKYSAYIIMPASFQNFYPLLDEIPKGRLYVLDQTKKEFKNKYPSVYQNFEKDMYQALTSGLDLLEKYNELILVFPGGKEPKGQMTGFEKFCNEYNKTSRIISDPFKCKIKKGHVYIVPNDRHLVYLVKKIEENRFLLGKDVGIISYNDTALKEIVAGGITTISTDFKKMGENLANLILNKKKVQIENPSSLIKRNSL